MTSSCDDNADVTVYYNVIEEHMDYVSNQMIFDQTMEMFPYKEAVVQLDYTKMISETDEKAKNKLLINHLLQRRQPHELKAFIENLKTRDNRHDLLVILDGRLGKAEQDSKTKDTPDTSSCTSEGDTSNYTVGGSSIHNELSSVEDPQTSDETDIGHRLRNLQLEKQHLEKELETARCTIRDKIKEITNLIEDKNDLTEDKKKLMEEKRELKKQLEDAQKEIERMQKDLECEEDKEEKIEELTKKLHNANAKLKKFDESKQSKLCSIL